MVHSDKNVTSEHLSKLPMGERPEIIHKRYTIEMTPHSTRETPSPTAVEATEWRLGRIISQDALSPLKYPFKETSPLCDFYFPGFILTLPFAVYSSLERWRYANHHHYSDLSDLAINSRYGY